jgi:hypothetical protein
MPQKTVLTTVYYSLGTLVLFCALLGGFWAGYATPKVKDSAKAEIASWYAKEGGYMIEDKIDTCITEKLKPLNSKLDLIFDMMLEKQTPDKKYEYQVKMNKVK